MKSGLAAVKTLIFWQVVALVAFVVAFAAFVWLVLLGRVLPIFRLRLFALCSL